MSNEEIKTEVEDGSKAIGSSNGLPGTPDPEMEGVMSSTQFRIGYDNQIDPKVMVFNIPLERCAADLEEGSALVRGKLEEAKQIALNLIKAKRERKKMLGGLTRPPNGLKLAN